MIVVPWDTMQAQLQRNPEALQRSRPADHGGTGVSNWNAIWPNLELAYVNIRNFRTRRAEGGGHRMLNTTWDDDGESLFEMTWPR